MNPSTARIGLGVAALALAAAGTVATAQPANAKPDTVLPAGRHLDAQGRGLLDDVARSGLPIAIAV